MNLIKAMAIGAAILAPVVAAPIIAVAQDLAPMALNSLPAAPPKIISAQVQNLHGHVIGHVQNVATDQNGRPSAISVMTPDGLKVVAAQAASYDESRNLVFTDQPAPGVANNAH